MEKKRIVTATFAEARGLLSACKALREKGYRLLDIHSPYPLEEMDALTGRKESPVRFWTFVFAVAGLFAGFWLTISTSLDWPHYTGGKPVVSLPPFLIIAFELTLLLGAFGTIAGFIFHSKTRRSRGKTHLTGDTFALSLIEDADGTKRLEEVLLKLGAKEIMSKDWTGNVPAVPKQSDAGSDERDAEAHKHAGAALAARKTPALILVAMAVLGTITFVLAASGADAKRAWQIYLVNLLYWTGACGGCMAFTAVLVTTGASWAKNLGRFAAGAFWFLPVSIVLFLITVAGREHIFPWINEAPEGQGKWMNIPFLYARDAGGWLVMSILSWVFVRRFRRGPTDGAAGRLGVILIIVFIFFFSLLGIDLAMGLSPEWSSTLFGGYFAVGAFYHALALALLLGLLSGERMEEPELAAMGKLIFGFSLFWASLFWAQYLVIWYGGIQEETGFVYRRLNAPQWRTFSWAALTLSFFVPFLLLLGKRAKANRPVLLAASVSITAGFFIERFVLVVPSISDKPYFGVTGLLVSAGFAAVFLLTLRLFAIPSRQQQPHQPSGRIKRCIKP